MGIENVWLIAIVGFCAFISNVFYMLGGTDGFGKWWRRFLGSFILACASNFLAVYLQNWTWEYLLIYPCLIAGFSLGYGGNNKWLKRSVFALGVLSALFVGVIICDFCAMAWIVFGLGCLVSVASVVLGVINPFTSSPAEQFIISQILTLFVPWIALISIR